MKFGEFISRALPAPSSPCFYFYWNAYNLDGLTMHSFMRDAQSWRSDGEAGKLVGKATEAARARTYAGNVSRIATNISDRSTFCSHGDNTTDPTIFPTSIVSLHFSIFKRAIIISNELTFFQSHRQFHRGKRIFYEPCKSFAIIDIYSFSIENPMLTFTSKVISFVDRTNFHISLSITTTSYCG